MFWATWRTAAVIPSGSVMFAPQSSSHRSGTAAKANRSSPVRPRGDRSTWYRKSTRLNSSHLVISYAVFCLKKKIAAGEIEISTPCDAEEQRAHSQQDPA